MRRPARSHPRQPRHGVRPDERRRSAPQRKVRQTRRPARREEGGPLPRLLQGEHGVQANQAHGSVATEHVNFAGGEYLTIAPSGGNQAIRLAEIVKNAAIDYVLVSEINDDSADIYAVFTYLV